MSDIIVVGCGRVGSQLATQLSHSDNNVTVIDRDMASFANLGPDFNGATIQGVGFDEDVLTEAGVKTCDAVAAVTQLDNTNLMIAEVCEKLHGVPHVVARLHDPSHERAYSLLGIDYSCGTTLVAQEIYSKLQAGHGNHVKSFGDVEIIQFTLNLRDHMRQTMLPALSGSMWTTKTDPLISSDGENAGVVIGRYSGGDARYEWRTERYGDKVMRIYDMNEVAKYYASTPSVRAEIEEYGERTDYSSLGGSNWVYVNYWGIEPGQTVEIQEKGKSLEVEKVSDEDPLFAVSFAPQWRDEEESEIFVSHKKKVSYHMFRAKAKTARRPITVIVRDAEGNMVRTETMKRPRAFSNDIWL